MRALLLAGFLVLLLLAAFSQEPAAPYEHTFEASRGGATAVDAPGPFTYPDFVRLLARRTGPHRLAITRDLRERPSPPVDLWPVALPGVFKLVVGPDRLDIVQQPGPLRMGVEVLYNIPVLIRNEGPEAVDVKMIGRIGEDGPTDRFRAPPGVSYFSFNVRPRMVGKTTMTIRIFAGMNLADPRQSPPESTLAREVSFPLEVTGWGTLALRTSERARVYVSGSDGLSYTPAHSLARITWSSGDYFYYGSGGVEEIRMPAGRASIEAVRGFEYEPATQSVEIQAGRIATANLTLQRRENLAREDWYSGDVHIHANYNNHEFITPEDVRDQVQAEDLNVANLMVANSSGPHIHDEQYFEGRPHRVSTPSHIVYWVEEMRNAGLYGHMCLIGLKSLVKPQHTGFANSAWPYDYPANHVQALEAGRQGGAASYAHPGYNFTDDPQTMSARELPVDLALGSIHAMDVLSNADEHAATALWYRLLNTGLRCAISAGTDSFTNRRQHWLPGGQRVYVQVPGRLDYQAWVDNYKAGRSLATNGPIIRFAVEGKGPGEEVRLEKPGPVTVTATVRSFVPFEMVELIANGKVVAKARASGDGRAATLRATPQLDRSMWLAARVSGPYHRLLPNDRFVYAHTSPVYCLVGSGRIGEPEDGQFFVSWIDRLMAMVEARGKYQNEAQKREVLELFRKGRSYYEAVARAEPGSAN
jgi:hypothetical protein